MNLDSLPNTIRLAVAAAQSKKASSITVLSLEGLSAFAEYFVICSAESVRQIEAIGEEVERKLREIGSCKPNREGRAGTEWLLLDFGNLVVHVFNENARVFYDIERLWRAARRFDISESGYSAARGAGNE